MIATTTSSSMSVKPPADPPERALPGMRLECVIDFDRSVRRLRASPAEKAASPTGVVPASRGRCLSCPFLV